MENSARPDMSGIMKRFWIIIVLVGSALACGFFYLDPLGHTPARSEAFARLFFYGLAIASAVEIAAMRLAAAHMRRQTFQTGREGNAVSVVTITACMVLSPLVFSVFYYVDTHSVSRAVMLLAFVIPAFLHFLFLTRRASLYQ